VQTYGARDFLSGSFLLLLTINCLCLPQPAGYASEGEGAGKETVSGEDLDALSRELQKEQERIKNEVERRRQERERAAAGAKHDAATLPSNLQKAWEYFEDYQNRDRDVAVKLFKDCLKDSANAAFTPEIYFRIGQLYSSHRKDAERRKDLMVKYYRLAHEGYGLKYSHYNMTAWASVINQPSQTLEDRLAYYDWLSGFEASVSPEQTYPIYAMGIVAQGTVSSYEVSERHLQAQAENLRHYLPMLLEVTSKNIVYRSNIKELEQIQELYPGSLMAKMAASKLEAIQKATKKRAEKEVENVVEETLDDETFVKSTAEESGEKIPRDISPAPAIETAQSGQSAPQEALPSSKAHKVILPFALVGIVVVAVVIIAVAKRGSKG